ncbi:hypothetical protein DOZ91_05650 [Peribacillus frigoritolerans]|nr:hypothetical protein DOZ91_05650 [Peribacillus frigoritolerans]
MTGDVFANWLFVKLNSWSKISPTYVGSWVSSSYSTAEKKRNYHATVVHYGKSNYNHLNQFSISNAITGLGNNKSRKWGIR